VKADRNVFADTAADLAIVEEADWICR